MTTSTTTEALAAIRSSAALFFLEDRAFLRITGPDATRWLNGMVTNNIAVLAPGEGNYNFLLNAQGRIQGDCTIYRDVSPEPAFLLATTAAQLEPIHQHLDKFIIMDDVELTTEPLEAPAMLLIGPEAPAIMQKLNLSVPAPLHLARAATPYDPALILTPPPAAVPQFEICTTIATVVLLRGDISAPAFPLEALEAFRILSAVPKFGVDITEKVLPQETAQTHALHFSKGCYLGQEIVERIHSRGQVHRTFTQFTLSGDMPTLPAPLESNSKPVGELTSAALVDGAIYALGYARREFLETNQPLSYPGGTGTPSTASNLIPKT